MLENAVPDEDREQGRQKRADHDRQTYRRPPGRMREDADVGGTAGEDAQSVDAREGCAWTAGFRFQHADAGDFDDAADRKTRRQFAKCADVDGYDESVTVEMDDRVVELLGRRIEHFAFQANRLAVEGYLEIVSASAMDDDLSD